MNKSIMRAAGLGEHVDLAESGKCPLCQKDIDPETEFDDDLSKREFGISGLCQTCQDSVFN